MTRRRSRRSRVTSSRRRSIAPGRSGSCGWSPACRATASPWSSRCTTAWSTASPARISWRRCSPRIRPRRFEEPRPFAPRHAPARWELLRDAVWDRLQLADRAGPRDASGSLTGEGAAQWLAYGRGLWEKIGAAAWPAPESPLNRPIGRHRRFDWTALDLDEVRAVRARLGGTINDVVLATVAGALAALPARAASRQRIARSAHHGAGQRARRRRAPSARQPRLRLAHDVAGARSLCGAALRRGARRHRGPQGLAPASGRAGGDVGGQHTALARLARRRTLAALQPAGHQRAGAAGRVVSPRRPPALRLPRGAAVPEPRGRYRALQLRGARCASASTPIATSCRTPSGWWRRRRRRSTSCWRCRGRRVLRRTSAALARPASAWARAGSGCYGSHSAPAHSASAGGACA